MSLPTTSAEGAEGAEEAESAGEESITFPKAVRGFAKSFLKFLGMFFLSAILSKQIESYFDFVLLLIAPECQLQTLGPKER